MEPNQGACFGRGIPKGSLKRGCSHGAEETGVRSFPRWREELFPQEQCLAEGAGEEDCSLF